MHAVVASDFAQRLEAKRGHEPDPLVVLFLRDREERSRDAGTKRLPFTIDAFEN